jgi:outer membrane protein TolC
MNTSIRKLTLTLVIFTGIISGLSTRAFSQNLTLEQVIHEACTVSDTAKMMNESVLKSDAVVRENRSAAFPKISTSAAINHDEPFKQEVIAGSSTSSIPSNTPLTWGSLQGMIGGFATPKPSTVYKGALSVSQPLITFGKVKNAIKVAETYSKSSQSTYKRNLQTLQLSALDMFYRTMIAIENARTAERTLKRKNDLHEFIDRNFRMGSGEKARLLTAKADAFNQSAVTIIAKRDAESARMYLNAFIGRPLTDTWTIDTSVLPEALNKNVPPLADTLITAAVEERNDVQTLRYMAESNRRGARIFRALYFPSIYANGSLGYTQIDSKGIMAQEGATNWTAGVSLSWTLFDGFQNSSKVAQYLSDARKLEIVEGTMKKAAEIEIRSAFGECGAADSTLLAAQEMFNAANEAFELTNNNYRQGSGSLTDLQRVDEQMQASEFFLINARYRQVRSHAALLVALGRDIININ